MCFCFSNKVKIENLSSPLAINGIFTQLAVAKIIALIFSLTTTFNFGRQAVCLANTRKNDYQNGHFCEEEEEALSFF